MSKLQDLSALLRDESRWPEDFQWDYGDFNTCAVGLGCRAGLFAPGIRPVDVEAEDLGMDPVSYWGLFVRSGYYGDITPEMIADKIDDWLAEHAPS
jgi:hypothetical protein